MAAVPPGRMIRPASILLDLIWPPRCVLCHKLIARRDDRLCPQCAASIPEPISGARRGTYYRRWASAFRYEEPLRSSFHRFKFGGCAFYADLYGRWLANAAEKQLGTDFDILTYVPISRLRLRRRGYDQVLLLANAAGKQLGLTPVCTLIKRSGFKPQSAMIDLASRKQNIRGAFLVKNPQVVRGSRVLLIDDVLTTGATVSEASRVLLEAGAKTVHVATLAVTEKSF